MAYSGYKTSQGNFAGKSTRRLPVKSNRTLLIFTSIFAILVNVFSVHISVERDKFGKEEQELQLEYIRLLSEVNELKGIRTKIKSDFRVEERARQLGMIDPAEPASWLKVELPEGSLPPELKEDNIIIPVLDNSPEGVSKASIWQLRSRGE